MSNDSSSTVAVRRYEAAPKTQATKPHLCKVSKANKLKLAFVPSELQELRAKVKELRTSVVSEYRAFSKQFENACLLPSKTLTSLKSIASRAHLRRELFVSFHAVDLILEKEQAEIEYFLALHKFTHKTNPVLDRLYNQSVRELCESTAEAIRTGKSKGRPAVIPSRADFLDALLTEMI